MGLFDFLSKSKNKSDAPKKLSDKELARMAKLVSSKMSQNYDRQEAIEELGKVGTSESARALLKRFDWTMEPSITDQEEKENAMHGIVAAGEAALDPIREYCKRAEGLTWPLKTLREIVPEEDVVDELLTLLDQFDTEYTRNPEPKIQLINTLEDFPSEDVRIAVEPFVQDASEPVRFAAVTTVFVMENPESVPILIAALAEEESLRVKNRIARGIQERGWAVPESLQETARDSLPPDFSLSGDKIQST